MKHRILVIDDDIGVCEALKFALNGDYDVHTLTTCKDIRAILEREDIDVILLDLRLGEYFGIDVLREIRTFDTRVAVIMMTAYGDEKDSIEAIRLGAFKYLQKPMDISELTLYIEQALELQKLNEEVRFLSSELRSYQRNYEMVGSSAPMHKVYDLIDKLKDVDTSVVILGESGTGKELVARAIHFSGKRAKERFVVVNCAAIPEGLLEEEFFGHRKGSFTGAVDTVQGKLALADKGTLFLDEIGDMPLAMQGKLLRVLQEREFTPIGGAAPQKTDIRVIVATNMDLKRMVREGGFREDLYYRLSVMDVTLPALRQRKNDIPALCDEFIRTYNAEQKKNVKCLSPAAIRLLIKYDYPGNVRQLRNIIEHAMILTSGDIIDSQMLPEELLKCDQPPRAEADTAGIAAALQGRTLKEVEKLAIKQALLDCRGKKSLAAQSLGISERSLWYKIKEYDIQ